MSRLTPFFCITVSSSFATSSKVKPYCRPEQPPPVTNTRSLSSLLPSSSISDFTLLAALVVNMSGSGINVAVDAQPAGEGDVALDGGAGADEAVDGARFVGLSEHGSSLQLIQGS